MINRTSEQISLSDAFIIGYAIPRFLLAALNPFSKLTNGKVHKIAAEAASIAFTLGEYRNSYLLDGEEYWKQAVKCGFNADARFFKFPKGYTASVGKKAGRARA